MKLRPFLARVTAVLVATTAVSALAGCGAVFNGTSSQIPATSSPDGAQVLVDGIAIGVTPTRIRLSHDKDHVVTFRFPDGRERMATVGKEVKGGYVVLDVLLAGIVGVVVDAATGGWNGPEVEAVHGIPTGAPRPPAPAGPAVAAAQVQ